MSQVLTYGAGVLATYYSILVFNPTKRTHVWFRYTGIIDLNVFQHADLYVDPRPRCFRELIK